MERLPYLYFTQAALKAEDGEDDEVGQLENLRRTPRIKSEGDAGRKSRRFSTGMPNKSGGMNKLNSAPSLTEAADEYQQRKMKLKE